MRIRIPAAQMPITERPERKAERTAADKQPRGLPRMPAGRNDDGQILHASSPAKTMTVEK